MDTWTSIDNGRQAFGDYLGALPPEDWNKPSLCDGWTVKDVAAHMLVIPTKSKGQVFGAFLRSGFNLDKMNAKFVGAMSTELTNEEIAAKTKESAGSRSMPPGLKLNGVFTELAVHSADVADGLGKPFDLPIEDYVACLQYMKDVQPVFRAKARIAGLHLDATDSDWSTGDGPAVSGTSKQLLLAMAGRRAAFDNLSGEGVDTMRSR